MDSETKAIALGYASLDRDGKLRVLASAGKNLAKSAKGLSFDYREILQIATEKLLVISELQGRLAGMMLGLVEGSASAEDVDFIAGLCETVANAEIGDEMMWGPVERDGGDASPPLMSASYRITDCHVHICPLEQFNPAAMALMRKRPQWALVEELCRSPRAFLMHMDAAGIERAVLINYVAPEVIGFNNSVNEWIAKYVKEDPRRLIACGSLHPRHTTNIMADVEQIVKLGLRLIKIHPPHQLLYPNDYLKGVKELEIIYRAAEANGIPVMFHTGTSIFPGARNLYGDPIFVDDVAVDFPNLKILLAHGGRPLWMDTSFFLVRRHKNVYLDISGIPPKTLLQYFPRLEEIAPKTVFGTDWPGPGVPDIKRNLDDFAALPLREPVRAQILEKTALEIWPE